MRTVFIVLVLSTLFMQDGIAQTVTIDEGFDDGDFTSNPTWTDPGGKHIVNGSERLQLNAPSATDEAVIYTNSDAGYGAWEAYVEFGFNPSGSNRAKFYIMSDSQDMKGSLTGYYIMIGDTPEEISLYRQDGNSDTIIIDGTDAVIDNNPVTVRVRVTRDLNGNWELFADPTGGTSYVSQGTVTDSTYQNSSYIGFLSDYTSTRSTLFQYDDIKVTKTNPPLEIQNITAQSNTSIDVQFNLDIDPGSVDAADFSLNNNAGSPNSTSLPSPNVVRLSYNSPLASNNYTLTVNNVTDSDGNTIDPNSTASFIKFGTYAPGDVIINELLYDPPSGQEEYVELKNLSGKYLDLQNWQIGDEAGNAPLSSGNVVLKPNGFVAVSSDTSTLFSVYGSRPYVESSAIPSLNNGGDVVKILTASGAIADSLRYEPSWGGANVSLERRSDIAPSIYRENFGNSPNPNGGTPGIANEVADDTTPPSLDNLTVVDRQSLNLSFSERLDKGAAANADNYSLSNGMDISSAHQTTRDSVQLSLSALLQNGTEYQLTINNQQDIFGNVTSPVDTSFTYYMITPPDSGDIFINEFMVDPPGGSSEYIELYNPTSKSFDLNGWTINDDNGTLQTITSSRFVVPPDSFVVIAPDNSLLVDNPHIALLNMGSDFPSLNNGGDDIVLRDSSGQRLDSLQYSSNWGGNNIALERRTTDVKPIRANFGDAPNGFGSPGRQNDIKPDDTPPDLQSFAILSNQSLRFVFSEQVDPQTASDPANYAISGGLSVEGTSVSADTVQISLSGALQNNTSYTATVNGVEDLFGTPLTDHDTTFTYYEISPADSGDIFINEFSYDPPEGSTEYIELYNPTNQSFDLNSWTINDNTGNRRTITDGQFIVPPNSFVVIAPDQTLLQSTPGILLVTMGSRFPSLNNSGDDIVLRNAGGQRLDSLQYSSSWGGSEVALERRTTDVKPIGANFGDAPNGFGTPGEANIIPNDTSAPDLASFSIVSNQSLQFVFTEQVEEQSATNTDNYALSGSISVNNAALSGSDTVRVQLSDVMQNNTEYTATIDGIDDVFGNTLGNHDTTFTYFEVSPADSGDIFINEFMFDPPSGQTEYVELYNPTGQSLNLQGWTINDNTGSRQIITDAQYIVPPDSFVVIAPDQTLKTNYPEIALVAMGSRFPSLNNSGDDVVLRDQDGTLLDSLRYTAEWGSNQVALERRTTGVKPIHANFGDAPNEFGTPGSANQIMTDNQPPVLHAVQTLDQSTLQLIFSERISSKTAMDRDSYAITPRRGIQLISSIRDTVTLFLSQDLAPEQPYQLTVSGLQDVFGNTIATATREIIYVPFSDAQQGDIVINEILYSRAGAGAPEFVELYNRTNQNFDLSGWRIGDASSTATLDSGTRLRAGEYLVITDNASLAEIVDNSAYVSNFPSLNDDKDAVYIQNERDTRIDSLFYTNAFGGASDGISAERKDPGAASNDPANFASSTADGGATPGKQNSVFQLDDIAPRITFSRIFANGDIEVRFSEFISLSQDLAFTLGQQQLTIDSFDPDNGNVIYLNTPSGTAPGSPQTITAQNLRDVSGNVTATAKQDVAQPLNADDVVINEILFDPLSDSGDNQPDQSEYIELRNIRDYAVSLEGITLHDAPDEDGAVRTLTPVSSRSKFIPARGTALIYADDETSTLGQSKLAEFFELKNPESNSVIQVDRSSLSLSSTDDAIFLSGKEGFEVDSVYYDESWHNPNLVDTDGIALERINPFGPSNDASNWGSSINEKGGTPNRENSLFQTSGNSNQQEVGISFTPNPFSPDDDGTEDNLFINYKLDQPDYLMTVLIYDRYGRLVRELADSKPAGLQGSLIWNGLKDNGSRNRIGIYIVIFKAFDSAGGDNRTFKKTVVLARRLN